jgi:hypothetical protein
MNKNILKQQKMFYLIGFLLTMSAEIQAQSYNVDSVLQHQPEYIQKHHINIRGNLNNSRIVFENEKVGRVAFLGGSITEMKGWHNEVMDQLKQRFPTTKFEFVEAGIGSTGSTPGAFRIKKDALMNGKVDLLFVEAAVNDHTNGFDSIAQIRGMEGEIRQALLSNCFNCTSCP